MIVALTVLKGSYSVLAFDVIFVFFFKQKTAYEVRISDWSSDVCSSDLKAIGEAVGVHPRTMAHWAQVAEHKGEKAAIAGGQRGVRQGDRRSLSSSQEVLIRTLMTDKMPDQLKLGFALWTRDAVRELIRQRCGFLMPVRTVGEYLKRWGYTPQRPLHRAYQQKPEVVQHWLDNEDRKRTRLNSSN